MNGKSLDQIMLDLIEDLTRIRTLADIGLEKIQCAGGKIVEIRKEIEDATNRDKPDSSAEAQGK